MISRTETARQCKEKQFSHKSLEFPPDKPEPQSHRRTLCADCLCVIVICYLLSFRSGGGEGALGPFVWPAVIINTIWRPLRVNGLNALPSADRRPQWA